MDIIKDKYIIVKKLGQGKFGDVLLGKDLETGESVAIKCEFSNTEYSTIKHEVKIMTYLYKNGFKKLPRIYWYGVENPYNILVMSYYDCNLENYRETMIEKHNFCDIVIQCIKIIRDIHSLFVLHRDIKPANFMVKNGELFLIDFGLSTFYTDEQGDHIANKHQETITGTPLFVSYNNHCHHRLNRRDDLVSLGYMFMFLKNGGLPWKGKSVLTTYKSWENISEYLQNDSIILKYMNHCYRLEYDETPNYGYLMELFL